MLLPQNFTLCMTEQEHDTHKSNVCKASYWLKLQQIYSVAMVMDGEGMHGWSPRRERTKVRGFVEEGRKCRQRELQPCCLLVSRLLQMASAAQQCSKL